MHQFKFNHASYHSKIGLISGNGVTSLIQSDMVARRRKRLHGFAGKGTASKRIPHLASSSEIVIVSPSSFFGVT